MRARVKKFLSPDADLQAYEPTDPSDVGILVQMITGPEDSISEESFDVLVCTPNWLTNHIEQNGPLIGRHHLMVNRWDWPEIQQFLLRQVESEEGSDWINLGEKLGRIGLWEFEDYRPWPLETTSPGPSE